MTSRRPHNQSTDLRALVGVDAADISTVVAQWRLANAFRPEFVFRRVVAQIGEEEAADRGDEQAPTERVLPVIGQAVVEGVFCRRFRVLLVTWLR
jgi:hypothetical protein